MDMPKYDVFVLYDEEKMRDVSTSLLVRNIVNVLGKSTPLEQSLEERTIPEEAIKLAKRYADLTPMVFATEYFQNSFLAFTYLGTIKRVVVQWGKPLLSIATLEKLATERFRAVSRREISHAVALATSDQA